MCRHDSCWGICAWWSVKPDTSGSTFCKTFCFAPACALRSPLQVLLGPRRSDAVGHWEEFESYTRNSRHSFIDGCCATGGSIIACWRLALACCRLVSACHGVWWLVMACYDMIVLESIFWFDRRRVAWHVNVANASEDEFLIVLVDVSAWLMLGHLRLVVCQARHFGKALSARRFVLPLRVP